MLVGAPGTSFGKEIDLIIAAKKHNVKTIAIGMSWDHFSAKYKLIRPVDRLIVWNHIMKNDAKKDWNCFKKYFCWRYSTF